MEENKKVIFTGIIVIVVVVLAVVIYYFFIREGAKEAPPVQKVVEEPQPVQIPEEEPPVEEEVPEPVKVELDKSDEFIREFTKELSSHPKLTAWLKSKNLIYKFTAAVDNIANGLSPRPQIDFFKPDSKFKEVWKDDFVYVDPKSYSRYNLVANVFASLDVPGIVKLYKQLVPLIQDAYKDLGYPGGDFNKTLLRATVELLRVPVVKGDILLEKKVITYAIVDPKLENLSDAQKHLLRMGPVNVRKILRKLRELGLALGFPENRLPRLRSYTPVNK